MFDISLYILCITAGSPERDTELSAVKYVQFAPYVMHCTLTCISCINCTMKRFGIWHKSSQC